jgi:hypothetical protein
MLLRNYYLVLKPKKVLFEKEHFGVKYLEEL